MAQAVGRLTGRGEASSLAVERSAPSFSSIFGFVTRFWSLLLVSVVGGVPSLQRGAHGRLGVRGRADRCFCPAQDHFLNLLRAQWAPTSLWRRLGLR